MKTRHGAFTDVRWVAAGAGLAAASYGAYVGLTWYRYGRPARPSPIADDPLLDQFMPTYEVREHHRVRVMAPAVATLAAAKEVELPAVPSVRAIFKARELILGASPSDRSLPRGLLAQTEALGWSVLADAPGRQVVVGAVTRPWEANVTFRGLPADAWPQFCEPGYVKIAWTLRADPVSTTESIFHTETRATTTDAAARETFRRYWSFFSPGIWLIRRMLLGPVQEDAERRARSVRPTS